VNVQASINSNFHTIDGHTPAHHAAQDGPTAILSLLVKLGAELGLTNEKDRHLVETAAKYGQVEAFECLLAERGETST